MSAIDATGPDYLFDSASSLFAFDDEAPAVPAETTQPDGGDAFFGRDAALAQSSWFGDFSDNAWQASDAIRADASQPGWIRDAVSLTQPVMAVGLGTLGLANDLAVAIKDPSLLMEPLRHPLAAFEHARQGIGEFFGSTNPFRQTQTLITNFADPALAGVHVAGQMGQWGRAAGDIGAKLAADGGRVLSKMVDEGTLAQPLRALAPRGLWGGQNVLLPSFATPLYAVPPRVHGLEHLFTADDVSVKLRDGSAYEDGIVTLNDQPLSGHQIWQLVGGFGNSTVTVHPPRDFSGFGITSIGNGGTVPYFSLSGWTDRNYVEGYESIVRFTDKMPRDRPIDPTVPQPVLPYGVGTQAKINQLGMARDLGLEKVTLTAAQSPAHDFVGLSVWPKLGFDGVLRPQYLPDGLLDEFQGADGLIRISDVIKDPAGRAGWNDTVSRLVEYSKGFLDAPHHQGYASSHLSFDLTPGSVSEQILADTVDRMNARIDADAMRAE